MISRLKLMRDVEKIRRLGREWEKKWFKKYQFKEDILSLNTKIFLPGKFLSFPTP